MRDLRVQEFFRELVVGDAAPSDLTGSFLVEILHCGEDGDEQVARISKQISRICDCSSLSLYSCSYILYALNCLHLYMLDIYLCLIVIYARDYLASCMLLFLIYSLHA